MKNHNHNHNTHNLSVISSETCSYKNETNSIHSSYLEYIEGNKAKNEWAKLLKNSSKLKNSGSYASPDDRTKVKEPLLLFSDRSF